MKMGFSCSLVCLSVLAICVSPSAASVTIDACNGTYACLADVTWSWGYHCTAYATICSNYFLTDYDGKVKLKFKVYFDDTSVGNDYAHFRLWNADDNSLLGSKDCNNCDCSSSFTTSDLLCSAGTTQKHLKLKTYVDGCSSCSDTDIQYVTLERPICPSQTTVRTGSGRYYQASTTVSISGNVYDQGCHGTVSTTGAVLYVYIYGPNTTALGMVAVTNGSYSYTYTLPSPKHRHDYGTYTVESTFWGPASAHPVGISWGSTTFDLWFSQNVQFPPSPDGGAPWGGDIAETVPFGSGAHFMLMGGQMTPVIQAYPVEGDAPTGTIPLTGITSPRGLAIVPDVFGGGGGYSLAAITRAGTSQIVFVNMGGAHVRDYMTSVPSPWGMADAPAGLWVASGAVNGSIYLLDLATGAEIRRITPVPAIGSITDISWDPETNTLMALAVGRPAVFRIRPSDGAVTEQLPLPTDTHRTVVNHAGGIYVADYSTMRFYLQGQTAGAPGTPELVSASSNDDTSIRIAWTDPPPVPEWSEIHVYRDGAYLQSVPAGTEQFLDGGLPTYAHHDYYLTAYRPVDAKEGAPSDTVDAYAGGRRPPIRIRVPSDYASIGEAIAHSLDGDSIAVASGTYPEIVRFGGRNIRIYSESGPAGTIIDAAGSPFHLVVFDSTETRSASFSGFTLKGCDLNDMGVITIGPDASPTIENNVIVGNTIHDSGGAILCAGGGSGAPLIRRNTIAFNRVLADTLGRFRGGGIYCADSPATLERNIIAFNDNAYGIYGDGDTMPTLSCNDLWENEMGGCYGTPAGAGDIAADPRFCNAIGDDYRLCADSPCLYVAGCGPLGALGQGCGACGSPLDYATHDEGNVKVTVTDRGSLGFLDGTQTQGSGFHYPLNGPNILYIGSLWAGLGPTYVCNRDYDLDPAREWVVATNPDGHIWVNGEGVSDQDILGGYTDAGAVIPRGISVRQESWAFTNPPNDGTVIIRYFIKNQGTTAVDNVYAGIFLDLDITTSGQQDRGGVGLQHALVYMHDGAATYAGLRLLRGVRPPDGEPVQDLPANMTLIPNATFVYPNQYVLDADKYAFLAGSDSQHVIRDGSTPGDYSLLGSAGPIHLEPGEMHEVVFALIGASNLSALQAAAESAQIRYLDPAGTGELMPLPLATRLLNPTPNPSTGQTAVRFDLARPGLVDVGVYDVEGRLVRSLFTGQCSAGTHLLAWDGRDDRGRTLASGIYFIRLNGSQAQDRRRIVLLR
jgi:hypothetical protein